MSELKLYQVITSEGPDSSIDSVKEMESSQVLLERDLQKLIEKNMQTFFGVRFLKSEYAIKNGRMDSIGIDENNCPVIFEYKRSQNENVINQGLFYLDWLLDHKADFKLLVMEVLGSEAAKNIEWSAPSVICVAHEFTRYDLHAVNRMGVNIKLVKYRRYNEGMILFEHLNTPSAGETGTRREEKLSKTENDAPSVDVHSLFEDLCTFIESLDDNISKNQLKLYLAYKRVRNFVCIEEHSKYLKIFLGLDPKTVDLECGLNLRDVSNVGHWGTGDLQLILDKTEDFEKAKPLIERAYNECK